MSTPKCPLARPFGLQLRLRTVRSEFDDQGLKIQSQQSVTPSHTESIQRKRKPTALVFSVDIDSFDMATNKGCNLRPKTKTVCAHVQRQLVESLLGERPLKRNHRSVSGSTRRHAVLRLRAAHTLVWLEPESGMGLGTAGGVAARCKAPEADNVRCGRRVSWVESEQ